MLTLALCLILCATLSLGASILDVREQWLAAEEVTALGPLQPEQRVS